MIDDCPGMGAALWAGRPKLVLASSSPRRRVLLEKIGALAEVCSPQSEESWDASQDPSECAEFLSRSKAESVAESREEGIVLGADTVVILDGRPMGKPASADEAGIMLRQLSGRTHEVVTGITMVDAGSGRSASARAATRVTFRVLSEAEIEAYVATGEPMDKAGAYGIQGCGGLFVERLDGCFHNVVGLPLALLVRTLDDLAGADATERGGA